MTSASRRRSTRWRPIRWLGCVAGTFSIRHACCSGRCWAIPSWPGSSSWRSLPSSGASRPAAATSRRTPGTGGLPIRHGETVSPTAHSRRVTWPGATPSTAFWTRPSSTSAMPSARASSSHWSWMRCRRPTRWPAIPLRSRSSSTPAAEASCMGWRISSATWYATAACRHRSTRGPSPSAGISQPRRGRSCAAPR